MSKLLLFIIISFTFCPSIQAQNKVKYAYDAAGNRIAREITLSTKTLQSEEPVFFEEKILERNIKIYPNPTQGQLVIDIDNLEGFKSGSVVIYNMQGIIIARNKIISNKTDIDISNKPTGIYIMHIKIDKEITPWKIIKE